MRVSHWAWVGLLGLAGGGFTRAAEPAGFELALQAALSDRRELEATDAAAGLRLSWRLARWLALDAELALAPAGLGEPAFSASRKEALGGVRVGRHLDGSGPYVLARGGVVRFEPADRPLPCILIFPPPLHCQIAQGDDLPAFDFGAGYRHAIGARARLFVELRDQLLRYEGPVLTADFEPRLDRFWSHNPRLVAGFGWDF